jgi:hypothetical protein
VRGERQDRHRQQCCEVVVSGVEVSCCNLSGYDLIVLDPGSASTWGPTWVGDHSWWPNIPLRYIVTCEPLAPYVVISAIEKDEERWRLLREPMERNADSDDGQGMRLFMCVRKMCYSLVPVHIEKTADSL